MNFYAAVRFVDNRKQILFIADCLTAQAAYDAVVNYVGKSNLRCVLLCQTKKVSV